LHSAFREIHIPAYRGCVTGFCDVPSAVLPLTLLQLLASTLICGNVEGFGLCRGQAQAGASSELRRAFLLSLGEILFLNFTLKNERP
jgi:hypothetical protein